jgi:DNA invertase Pin-like site-specific DNA recombinase
MKKIRCAIYTRKSSEEGLEQDFNSLDAQREACAAYVLSQASEGWNLLPETYDDGGISGGTLERPALQRLLANITAGKIDIIVVYKVDRLTRSLLDFAKLVETFDKAEVSFVSVTQSFNTTTSMGRLTLNMLLSFAQFEREVTAERIRDKIAASKAKGMWMGGVPPLGYKPDGRSLAIVEAHAALIREIFRRYLDLGTVRLLVDSLEADDIRTPLRTTGNGKNFGGVPFSRGQLYKILGNPIYVGDIPHQGKLHKGQHQAIIDRETWDAAQALLTEHTQGGKRVRTPQASLLAGIIVDGSGEPMYATHATKKKVRYRYYVSRSLQLGEGDQAGGMRLPARDVEGAVKEQVAQLFDDPLMLASRLALDISPRMLRQMTAHCETIANDIRGRTGGPLAAITGQVRAFDDHLEIDLSIAGIAELLGSRAPEAPIAPFTIRVAFRLTRTGIAMRLVQRNGALAIREANEPLVNLVALAHKWWAILAQGQLDAASLAKREGVTKSYLCRVIKVAFLAPDVVDAILEGGQHAQLDSGILRQPDSVPPLWEKQAEKFLPTASEGRRRSS